jgi:hypothetical protein
MRCRHAADLFEQHGATGELSHFSVPFEIARQRLLKLLTAS